MLTLIRYTLWVVVILALTIGLDLLMTKVPLEAPGLKQGQVFYIDFRARLIDLFSSDETPRSALRPEDMIEQVIEHSREEAVAPKKNSQRYLYVDENGSLQFADSLNKVPLRFRDQAQPMAD